MGIEAIKGAAMTYQGSASAAEQEKKQEQKLNRQRMSASQTISRRQRLR